MPPLSGSVAAPGVFTLAVSEDELGIEMAPRIVLVGERKRRRP
jgi:hypothetical protein